ncbi:LysR family transcriptional regulator [Massilia sp. KIM]|uniref:LysR substrate-binding domain-containing protein n=1 Tax=Massilia sp. KIM TaxID=1955422 RepID=UPI00098EA576|nr:LysR substrate-binding domain-containing protein [Massilia sp. KIM]OON63394.1 LysR family transcriptional regulator [Massilia sp. KIM]
MLSRDIDIFRVVMTSGSATRAGKLLGLSQSAVSMALRRLEEQAGLALFQRTGGKLLPTEEAQALLAEVQQHFIGMEVIEHRMRSLRQFGAGRVRIASFPGLGVGFVPRVLADLKAERERTLVSLQVMGSPEVRTRVLRGEVELGLVADSVALDGLEHALFAQYFGVVALPAGHPLARHAVLTPKQLSRYPFVALNPDDVTSMRLDAICRAHGVQLQTVVESSYTISLCELVRHGVGIGIVNPITAFDYLGAGLVFRPFSERLDFAALTVWPADRPLAGFARNMLVAMRKRLERDMAALREQMPAAARAVELHRFHRGD